MSLKIKFWVTILGKFMNILLRGLDSMQQC